MHPRAHVVCSGSRVWLAVGAIAVGAVGVTWTIGEEQTPPAPAPATAPANAPTTAPATRPAPKRLSDNVKRGLEWLVKHQLPSGGWGQGDEAANMRGSGSVASTQLSETPNVADTCAAALALLRSGSTPASGPYAPQLRKAAEFICEQVEKSDSTSLFITETRGTRLQSKLGTYIDTFLAGLTLAEMKDHMSDEPSRKRVVAALDKTMDKIEKNQNKDGGWANQGWAPALAQGVAAKSVNVAAQRGVEVDETVRKRAEEYAKANFDSASGSVGGGGGAGVELYTRSANLQSIKDSNDTNKLRERDLERSLAAPTTTPAQVAQIQAELSDIRATRQELAAATQATVNRVDDPQFIAGFGSNGGEEFLSYMNIGEALLDDGGDAWIKWDQSMTANLNRIQNDDGSWSGHHCVTGKSFCTSTALMVLMTDRMTISLSDQIQRR